MLYFYGLVLVTIRALNARETLLQGNGGGKGTVYIAPEKCYHRPCQTVTKHKMLIQISNNLHLKLFGVPNNRHKIIKSFKYIVII